MMVSIFIRSRMCEQLIYSSDLTCSSVLLPTIKVLDSYFHSACAHVHVFFLVFFFSLYFNSP